MQFIELKDVKDKMVSKIAEYEKDKQELDTLNYKISIIEEILNYFDVENLKDLKDNYLAIELLLGEILNEEEIDSYMNKILSIVNKDAEYEKCSEAFETEKARNIKKFQNILTLLNMLYKDSVNRMELLKLRIKQKEIKMDYLQPVIESIDCKTRISKYQEYIIHEFMKENNYSKEDRIVINEKIFENNVRAIKKTGYTNYNSRVLRILNKNIQFIELKGILKNGSQKNVNRLDQVVNSMVMAINIDSEYKSICKTLSNYILDIYSEDEVLYLKQSLLNYYLKHMKDDQNDLLDEEMYFTYDIRQMISEDFLNKLAIYYRINRAYQLNKNEIKEEPLEVILIKNNLVFAKRNENSSYLEKDISKMPNEKLERVKYLIEGFRYDTLSLSEIKAFNSAHNQRKKFIELKSDQVRIICVNISNNNYSIIGAGIKKADNDNTLYDKFAERLSKISEKFDETQEEQTYNKVLTYIDSNSRKTNR